MSNHQPWGVYAPNRDKLDDLVSTYRTLLTGGMPGVNMPVHQVLQQALETAIYHANRGATVNEPDPQKTQPATD